MPIATTILSYMNNHRTPTNEGFSNNEYNHDHDNDGKGAPTVFLVILFIIELLLMVAAAYLSWTSNTLINTNVVLKVFYAFWAVIFYVIYIFIHLVNKLDLLLYIESIKPPK